MSAIADPDADYDAGRARLDAMIPLRANNHRGNVSYDGTREDFIRSVKDFLETAPTDVTGLALPSMHCCAQGRTV
jgi:hypothetical protein